ncbi:uncharacterized protein BBOV_IV003925 [Babesia bovis T2Bo]|uniref:uncharacterized protein n=1 Tax=Babesia bovis T2Bo TaxID=484906 RepID=UPI001D647F5D|nr:uncharacterized protein BBOV_IV003925 [Babesia bovis T2Bo]KAG6439946.1 hypothetical protein BBOV_IV003925 [Babesia bovis T2Bo]
MQNSKTSTLGKLRFMQQGRAPEPKATEVVERVLDDDTAWVSEGFEEVHKSNSAPISQDNSKLKITYASRKSYNGANPYIERYMQSFRKRK